MPGVCAHSTPPRSLRSRPSPSRGGCSRGRLYPGRDHRRAVHSRARAQRPARRDLERGGADRPGGSRGGGRIVGAVAARRGRYVDAAGQRPVGRPVRQRPALAPAHGALRRHVRSAAIAGERVPGVGGSFLARRGRAKIRRPHHPPPRAEGRHAVNPCATDGHPQAGFTLVELLVAITLMTFLSAALLGSIRFGVTAWGRGTERSDQVHASMLAQNLLRRLIAGAYPLFLASNLAGRVDFEGTGTSLHLLAPVPIALGTGGRARVTLSVEQRNGHAALLMAANPELADREPDPTRKTLLADLDGADFAYFGAKRSDKAAQWHDAWSGELALPEIIRVRVRFAHGDARLWPDLLV